MTQRIETIGEIASGYDVIVFDQWGVLHNGSTAYSGAIEALATLSRSDGLALAVLSNSGKRAGPNAKRISDMGFDQGWFDCVMTSGEALWLDVRKSVIEDRRFFPVERSGGDARSWAEGLDVDLVDDTTAAEAVLLMGLPDGTDLPGWEGPLAQWLSLGLRIYCSNPDRQSPRADGLVTSPGAIAHRYKEMGGEVLFYGKPHSAVFRALNTRFGQGRYLMVGDSMEHDIAGAQGAGWDSLLVEGGLYADRFRGSDGDKIVKEIAAEKNCKPPSYRIEELR